MPLVTIGICVKNMNGTVGKTLKSVEAQTYGNIEVVIVDGTSGDGTWEKLSSWNPPFPVRREREKVGLGYARKVAVEISSGEYMQWVDADDVMDSRMVESQVEHIEALKDYGGVAAVPLPGRVSSVGRLEAGAWSVFISSLADRDDPDLGSTGGMFRTEALKDAGNYDPTLSGCEDTDISWRLKEKGWHLGVNLEAHYFINSEDSLGRIWRRYRWYGWSDRQLLAKHGRGPSLLRKLPPVAFVAGVGHIPSMWKYAGVLSLLHPFLHAFKRTAWCVGYCSGH